MNHFYNYSKAFLQSRNERFGIAYLEWGKYSEPEELWQRAVKFNNLLSCFNMPLRIGIERINYLLA